MKQASGSARRGAQDARKCSGAKWVLAAIFLAGASVLALHSQAHAASFDVTVLGAGGGVTEGNLSAYLVHPAGDARSILCDAGSLVAGLERADRGDNAVFADISAHDPLLRATSALHRHVHAYLISHAHMDHIAGLTLFSPEDTAKPILGLPSVIHELSAHIFNNAVWPNMGDRGPAPRIGRYHYQDLIVGQVTSVDQTGMSVTAYPLSHGGVESTAFVIRAGQDGMVYLGDTGADEIEHSAHLSHLWNVLAPMIHAGHLRGIIIECSYTDSRADKRLFGHLKPHWLLRELHALNTAAGGGHALQGLTVLIGHIKPVTVLGPSDPGPEIMAELRAGNDLGIRFIRAEQGATVRLP